MHFYSIKSEVPRNLNLGIMPNYCCNETCKSCSGAESY